MGEAAIEDQVSYLYNGEDEWERGENLLPYPVLGRAQVGVDGASQFVGDAVMV